MKVAEFIRDIKSHSRHFHAHFPRAHVLMASGLTIAMAGILALPSGKAEANKSSAQEHRLTEQLKIQLEHTDEPEAYSETAFSTEAITEDGQDDRSNQAAPLLTHLPATSDVQQSFAATASPVALEAPVNTFKTEQVKSGDTLSVLFRRAGFNDRVMYQVLHSGEAGKALAKLRPGQAFTFEVDESGKLVALHQQINRLESQSFTRTDNSTFEHSSEILTPDVKVASRSGTITTSLYMAGKKASMDENLIMELASIFGWDIDFALDIRKGDRFKLVFEESFLDGERLGSGAILAAEFINQGTSFRAVRYVRENGDVEYYTPTGNAMEKAFLRAPLDFRRISSNFNPSRLHPISGRVRPHRGTDYAAPHGTPVWSAGDGRVIRSAYDKANGNYVVIQHGNNIQTKYLHLQKRKVKTGQRVKQKQIIGTVGTTGYSTGPHLHYEFLLNGVHRNPRTIVNKLPKAESIPKAELPRFYQQTQPLLAELDGTTQMAANEHSPSTTTAL